MDRILETDGRTSKLSSSRAQLRRLSSATLRPLCDFLFSFAIVKQSWMWSGPKDSIRVCSVVNGILLDDPRFGKSLKSKWRMCVTSILDFC